MANVRSSLFELRGKRAHFVLDQVYRGLQIFQVRALDFGLLAAEVEDAMEPEFKSFHWRWSLSGLI